MLEQTPAESAVNSDQLIETAHAMFGNSKGLLAIDESNPACNKQFAELGIAESEEQRRAYRELLVTTPELNECISGVILYDETIRQNTASGESMMDVLVNHGILPGIKVDTGAKPLAGHSGEKVSEGLDGLRARASASTGNLSLKRIHDSDQNTSRPGPEPVAGYPAKKAGVRSIQVRDPNESKRVIEAIIACLDGAQPTNPPEETRP